MTQDAAQALGAQWRFDCAVTFSDGEVAQIDRWSAARAGTKSSGKAGWRLFGLAVATGFIAGFLAVMGQVVRPDRAGGVAVVAFLAFLAGTWGHYAMVRRTARQTRAEAWQEIGRHYTLALDQDGLEWSMASRTSSNTTRLSWAGLMSAQEDSGFIVFRTRRGNAVYLPTRALPAMWPAAVTIAAVEGGLRRSRQESAGT